ncbi:hypothetical protein OG394_24640 [Kribbella sp. NBC_01245]|uniref:hypothetical protein n=1 Tax=Kribbella sp. NBC_01245 TaxID=2903578 RepID=UPI002E2D9F96|nr:hypothetical protein [Kribbella sp. NBC_01245]
MTAVEPKPGSADAAGANGAAGTEDGSGGSARSGETALPTATFSVGLPQVARLFGTVIAPTTLLTALLFWFGWQRGFWFYDYFGVDTSLLGLTTVDYLVLSVDGLFIPMVVLACLVLLAIWGRPLVRRQTSIGPPVLLICGSILTSLGLIAMFVEPLRNVIELAAPLSLAAGVLLLSYANHLRRAPFETAPDPVTDSHPGSASRADGEAGAEAGAEGQGGAGIRAGGRAGGEELSPRRMAEWAGVFALVGICLFWATNDYSSAVGRTRAEQFVGELPTVPNAVVYSTGELNLGGRGVIETACTGSKALYAFRYDGLKLVLQSNDQYLLLPAAWTPADGIAVLLPRNDNVRLELYRGTPHPTPTC